MQQADPTAYKHHHHSMPKFKRNPGSANRRTYVDLSDDVALMDNWLTVLVLASEKPVAEVSSGHWGRPDDGG